MHHIFCRREIQLLERHLAVILGMVYFKKTILYKSMYFVHGPYYLVDKFERFSQR